MKLTVFLPVLAALKLVVAAPVPQGLMDDIHKVHDGEQERFDERQRVKEYWARMLGYPFTWTQSGRLDVIREGYSLVHHPELTMKYNDFVKHMKDAKKVAKVEAEKLRKKQQKEWSDTLAHEYYKFVDEAGGIQKRAVPVALVERQVDEKADRKAREREMLDQYAKLPEPGARQLTQKEASGRPLYPWNWPAGAGSSKS